MGGEWPNAPLGESGVTLIDCDHRTPPAASTGYPYVAIPQLKSGRIDLSNVRRISAEHFVEWTRKASPQPFDVVLSRRCNPGETAFVAPDLKFALGQNLVLLRSNGTKILPEFLRWLVRGPQWWEQVQKFLNVGAVFDSLRCADVPKFELPVPPLAEQRAIARVLGALDDKIELNRKMNATLEAMARALFKSWFVDFDPVRAKAKGRAPWGIDAETAKLLPSEFVKSELGPIPKGWVVTSIGDLLSLEYGKALKESERQPGEVLVFGSNGVVGRHSEALVRGSGIVVGRKGNPGIVTWAPSDFFVIDTAFYVTPKDASTSLRFLRHLLESLDLARLSADSAVPGVNRNAIYAQVVVRPTVEVLVRFHNLVEMWGRTVASLDEQSVTLARLRDELLPRLLSGELSADAAEHEVEAVA